MHGPGQEGSHRGALGLTSRSTLRAGRCPAIVVCRVAETMTFSLLRSHRTARAGVVMSTGRRLSVQVVSAWGSIQNTMAGGVVLLPGGAILNSTAESSPLHQSPAGTARRIPGKKYRVV